MEWLHKKECPWGERKFDYAAYYGSLRNIIWLYEKGCPGIKLNQNDRKMECIGMSIRLIKQQKTATLKK